MHFFRQVEFGVYFCLVLYQILSYHGRIPWKFPRLFGRWIHPFYAQKCRLEWNQIHQKSPCQARHGRREIERDHNFVFFQDQRVQRKLQRFLWIFLQLLCYCHGSCPIVWDEEGIEKEKYTGCHRIASFL